MKTLHRILLVVSIVLVIHLFSLTSLLAVDDLLALQGNVRQSGVNLASGNITIMIYDAPSGGNLIYNSTDDFHGAISDGKYDIMLGNGTNDLSLKYGELYYIEMEVNKETFTFNGSSRQIFQSAVGNITELHIQGSEQLAYLNASNTFSENQVFSGNITVSGTNASFSGNITADTGFFSLAWAFLTNVPNMVTGLDTNNNPGSFLRLNSTSTGIGYNQTILNNTISAHGLAAGFNRTYNASYAGLINNASYLSTYNATYAQFAYNQTEAGDDRFVNVDGDTMTSWLTITSGGLNVTGESNFDGNWLDGGVTIDGGDVYAQTLYVYNITSLAVNTLNINGSQIPSLNNTFDLGNASDLWRSVHVGDTLAVRDRVLYASGSSRRVGIGTTSPGVDLVIQAADGGAQYLAFAVDSDSLLSASHVDITGVRTDSVGTSFFEGGKSTSILFNTRDLTGTRDFTIAHGSAQDPILTIEGGDNVGNVGIGTASPGDTLTVNGTTELRTWDGAGDVSLEFESVGAKRFFIWLDDVNSDLVIGADDTTNSDLVIDTSGRIGIGTASPSNLLDVNGFIEAGGADTITSAPPTVDTDTGWKIGLYSNTYAIGVAPFTNVFKSAEWNSFFDNVNPAGDASATVPDSNALAAFKSDVQYFAGNVGIDRISPTYALDVVGNSTSTYPSIARFVGYDSDNAITRGQVVFSPAGYQFTSFVTGGGADFAITDADNTQGRLALDVDGNSGSTDILSADSTGLVGIGTDTPGHELEVYSSSPEIRINSTGTQAFLRLSGSGGMSTIYQDGAYLRIYDGSSNMFNMVNEGISIGPVAPLANSNIKLRLSEGLLLPENYPIYFNAHYDTVDGRHEYVANGEAAYINMDTSGNLEFRTAPSGTASDAATLTNRFFIENTGNVGIGTSDPDALLDVRGNIEGTYLEFKPVLFWDFNSDTTGEWTAGGSTIAFKGNSTIRQTASTSDPTLSRTTTYMAPINGSQNQIVKVKYKWVSGTDSTGGMFYATGGGGHSFSGKFLETFNLVKDGEWHTLVLDMSSVTIGGKDWVNSSITALRFDFSGSSDMVIDIDYIAVGGQGYGSNYIEGDTFIQEGSLGIGTEYPTSDLHVVGNANITTNLTTNHIRSQIASRVKNYPLDLKYNSASTQTFRLWNQGGDARLEVSSGDTGMGWLYFQANSDWSIGADSQQGQGDFFIARDINLDVNDAVFYIRNSTGNVGIGTNYPNATLHIARYDTGILTNEPSAFISNLSINRISALAKDQIANKFLLNFDSNSGDLNGNLFGAVLNVTWDSDGGTGHVTGLAVNVEDISATSSDNVYGVSVNVKPGNAAGQNAYGFFSNVTKVDTSGDTYGGYFEAESDASDNAYGVYATARGGGNNYAAYFDGNVTIGDTYTFSGLVDNIYVPTGTSGTTACNRLDGLGSGNSNTFTCIDCEQVDGGGTSGCSATTEAYYCACRID